MPLSSVTVTVVAAGPTNAGKTSLITRFMSDTFNENYAPTSFFRYQHNDYVGTRLVRFIIWDTSGSIEANTGRSLAYREADVFLLCYNISEPSSLFSAICNGGCSSNHTWAFVSLNPNSSQNSTSSSSKSSNIKEAETKISFHLKR